MKHDADYLLMYFAAMKGPQWLVNNPHIIEKYEQIKARYSADMDEEHPDYNSFVEDVRKLVEAPTITEMFLNWITGRRLRMPGPIMR